MLQKFLKNIKSVTLNILTYLKNSQILEIRNDVILSV